jgi:hypothetical protein
MSDINIVNPGLVNVADQADGLISVDQTKIVTRPSTNSGPITQGATLAPGKGTALLSPSDVTPAMTAQRSVAAADEGFGVGVTTDSPSDVTPPMTAQRTVEGGTDSPVKPDTINTTPNTVCGQPESTQQYSRTINVFV